MSVTEYVTAYRIAVKVKVILSLILRIHIMRKTKLENNTTQDGSLLA
jgi:energy-converting hydrogenase Eha subunit A